MTRPSTNHCRECNTHLEHDALLCERCMERFTEMMERNRDRECRENGRET